MIKVSVVVPVYNGEKYLEQCIRSVLDQTLDELEVICVDDGSADTSPQIIRRFQEEDTRVVLFRQENQGAGAARNFGIRKARGRYVAFLDADDFYVDQDALRRMYDTCEVHGMAACASMRIRLENGVMRPSGLFQDVEKSVALRYDDFQLDYDYQSFIFLREFLTEKGILFPHYRRFQDPPFLVRTLYEAKEFVVADTYLYCYRVPDMVARFDAKKTRDLLCGLIDNLEFAKTHGLRTLFRNTEERLEYEYEIVICRNARAGDPDVLRLLNQANRLVAAQYGTEDYLIRPLRILAFDTENYEKRLTEKIESVDEIVIYGAGSYGQIFLGYLQRCGFGNKVKSFVVSEVKGNRTDIGGVPVRPLQDDRAFIFVTASEKVQKEIEVSLVKRGYMSYWLVRVEFLDMLDET